MTFNLFNSYLIKVNDGFCNANRICFHYAKLESLKCRDLSIQDFCPFGKFHKINKSVLLSCNFLYTKSYFSLILLIIHEFYKWKYGNVLGILKCGRWQKLEFRYQKDLKFKGLYAKHGSGFYFLLLSSVNVGDNKVTGPARNRILLKNYLSKTSIFLSEVYFGSKYVMQCIQLICETSGR